MECRVIRAAQDPRNFWFPCRFPLLLAACLITSQSLRGQTTNFLPAVNYAVGGQGGVAVGDFNGDGKPDIVAANQDATVGILLGNGDGTFQSQQLVAAAPGYYCQSVAVGDFNGDGKPDLAVLCLTAVPGPGITQGTIQGTINILLGNGQGAFGSPTTISLNGADPLFVLAADFRKNGKTDLAVLNVASATVSILLGNGDGTFQSPLDYSTVANPAGFTIGDLNGDGYPDLAVAGQDASGNGIVSVLLGSSAGTFGPHTDWITSGQICTETCGPPTAVTIGDFNNDGKQDLAVNDGLAGGIFVLLGNGDGSFQEPAVHSGYAASPFGGLTAALVAGDFNGDGKLDLAESIGSPYRGFPDLLVFIGPGDGTFQLPVELSVGTIDQYSSATAIVSADLNGDKFLDLVLATNEGRAIGSGYNAATVVLSCGLSCSNVALTSSSATSSFDQSVTFTATVTPGNAKATGTPTGSVVFQDVTTLPATTIGTATLSGGTATLADAGLSFGTHMISATYQGDANFVTSTSAQIVQNVSQGSTTVSVSSSPNPSNPGQSVTFTVAVQPSSPVAPAGNVTLSDNGTATVSVQVSNGSATFSTSSLTAGTHSIAWSYSGDPNFNPGTSPTLSQIVGTSSASLAISSSATSATVGAGQTASFILAITPLTGFNASDSISFNCSGLPLLSACNFSPATLTTKGSVVTTMLSITTKGPATGAAMLQRTNIFAAVSVFLGAAICLPFGRKKKLSSLVTLVFVAFLAVAVAAACGGSGSSAPAPPPPPAPTTTPAGTYTVVVTATAGGSSQTQNLSLTVTP